MGVYLSHIGTAHPEHRIPQTAAADFMVQALALDPARERILRSVYRASSIAHRYSVLPDYAHPEQRTFFPATKDLEPFPTTAQRMVVFRKHAVPLALKAIHDGGISSSQLAGVTHLITVSCTGLYAPGLDLQLVETLSLNPAVERTAIQFMGCYAVFNALKVARSIVMANPDARVLLVSVELCSLHFQKSWSTENVVVNALFGDGAVAALVTAQPPETSAGYALNGFRCAIATEGKDDMSWDVGETGFIMGLTTAVPALLRQKTGPVLQEFLGEQGLQLDQIDHWAVHPGGKKILEEVESALSIPTHRNQAAYEVLEQFGNMSSATILFVLKALLNQPPTGAGKTLAMAFGPGLTLESGLLTRTDV